MRGGVWQRCVASRVLVGGVAGARKGSQFDVMIAAVTRVLAKVESPAVWKVDLERSGRNPLQPCPNHFLYTPTHVVSMRFRR